MHLTYIISFKYDEGIVVTLLQDVLDSKQERSAALALRGPTAIILVNFLLEDVLSLFILIIFVLAKVHWLQVLDRLCINLQHPLFQRRSDARRLLVMVAECSNELPESLYLRDVKYTTSGGADRMGGFSDVYRGSWNHGDVCVKRLRTAATQFGQEPANIKRVRYQSWGCFEGKVTLMRTRRTYAAKR